MKYTVKDLLESQQFPEMRLVCGRRGIHREISDVKIIEKKNMENFLHGGELLLTSFDVYKECSDKEFETYLKAIERKSISGFVVKQRRENDPTGIRMEMLKVFCVERDIPVFEIPKDLYYWGIIRYLTDKLFDAETARLKYFKTIHDNFSALSFLYSMSTTKKEDIIDALSNILDNPVSLYYSDYRCVASSEGDAPDLTILDNVEHYLASSKTKFPYMKQKGEWVQYIIRLDSMNHTETFLVITEKNRVLTELDYMAIENAIVSLQYTYINDFAQKQVEKKYKRDIVRNIVNGTLNEAEVMAVAEVLGLKESEFYRVIDFCIVPQGAEDTFTNEQLYEVSIIENEITTLIPNVHTYKNLNEIVMIQKVNPSQQETEFQKEIMAFQEVIQKDLHRRKKSLDFHAGIGNVVKGFHSLKDSYDYARKAIRYIDVIRQLYGNANKSVASFSNLGFFQIFGDMKAPADVLQYVPETLQKVYQYDAEHGTELINTLQVYLNNDRSIRKTAQDLFVHYRTISYRLDKIIDISGMDFQNPHEMLAVRNGLIIHNMACKLTK